MFRWREVTLLFQSSKLNLVSDDVAIIIFKTIFTLRFILLINFVDLDITQQEDIVIKPWQCLFAHRSNVAETFNHVSIEHRRDVSVVHFDNVIKEHRDCVSRVHNNNVPLVCLQSVSNKPQIKYLTTAWWYVIKTC